MSLLIIDLSHIFGNRRVYHLFVMFIYFLPYIALLTGVIF